MTAREIAWPSWSRRNLELAFVIAVLGMGYAGLFSVEQGLHLEATVSTTALVAIAALALFGHAAIRRLAPLADPLVYPIALLLNLLGLVMIHRLDLADQLRAEAGDVISLQAGNQAVWFGLGVFLLMAVLLAVKDHRQLQRYTYTMFGLGLLLLLLPLAPVIGKTINGARLWIGIAGYSFQPAEAAKILLASFFAGYLARRKNAITAITAKWFGIGVPRLADVGPLLVAWAASLVVLISQRDVGTSLLFFGLFVGMLYAATGQRTWLALGAVLFTSGAAAAYLLFGHVQSRVSVWLDPFAHAHDDGYQLVQALYGFSSGGLFGRGFGRGFSWLVPYAKSDFILSAFGEELGYVGLVALLLLYAILVQRLLRLALTARDDFGRLLSLGLALVLALQVFVVLGGVSRLIPLTGLTTPFLAAGGSALVANWVMVALILRISHTTATLNLPAGEAA